MYKSINEDILDKILDRLIEDKILDALETFNIRLSVVSNMDNSVINTSHGTLMLIIDAIWHN